MASRARWPRVQPLYSEKGIKPQDRIKMVASLDGSPSPQTPSTSYYKQRHGRRRVLRTTRISKTYTENTRHTFSQSSSCQCCTKPIEVTPTNARQAASTHEALSMHKLQKIVRPALFAPTGASSIIAPYSCGFSPAYAVSC